MKEGKGGAASGRRVGGGQRARRSLASAAGGARARLVAGGQHAGGELLGGAVLADLQLSRAREGVRRARAAQRGVGERGAAAARTEPGRARLRVTLFKP